MRWPSALRVDVANVLPLLASLLAGFLVARLKTKTLPPTRSILRLGTGETTPFAQGVVHGDIVYLAGVTANADAANGPISDTDSVEAQTKRVLDVIDARLARAGTDKSKVLSAQVWLKDITKDFAAMNSAWNAWVGDPKNKPVRATVQAKLATPAMLVEIMVTAAV